ncbi:MAG TPA: leucyl/phenylalanyl-tRNA--protein transferase [Acidimicrobiales bacterium]|nr:leucyl/phenylalanyl-tRNA--protein transferase [Acidimicrobiales bacterium]
MPVEPPPCTWSFPDVETADESGVVGIGGDLEPSTLLHAYRHGLFPMHVDRGRTLAWWSPDPRGILPLDGLRVTRSLRRSCADYEIRVDTAFGEVLASCADPKRPHGWITADIRSAYCRLHELGWAHSVEAWSLDDGTLAGGLYGVSIGGFFAGESMFHRRRDASKVALVGLVEILAEDGLPRLLDVQWTTEHLRSLGAVDVPRNDYIGRLEVALSLPMPPAFTS